jgi:hypothetical protein
MTVLLSGKASLVCDCQRGSKPLTLTKQVLEMLNADSAAFGIPFRSVARQCCAASTCRQYCAAHPTPRISRAGAAAAWMRALLTRQLSGAGEIRLFRISSTESASRLPRAMPAQTTSSTPLRKAGKLARFSGRMNQQWFILTRPIAVERRSYRNL